MTSSDVVVVAGGAGAIGAAIVDAVVKRGYHAVVVERSPTKLEALGARAAVTTVVADIGDATDVDERVRPLFDDGAYALVNCAAILGTGDIESIDFNDWAEVLRVNLTGTYLLCRAAVAGMRQRRRGRIINFASIGGQSAARSAGIHYSAAKAGVIGLSRTLAGQVASDGITVNVVSPARIQSRLFDAAHSDPVALAAEVPIGRLGKPVDVAGAVVFLLSADAGFITGSTLDVNGGVLMR